MKLELLQIVRTAQKGLYVGKYEVLSGEASRKRRLSGFCTPNRYDKTPSSTGGR